MALLNDKLRACTLQPAFNSNLAIMISAPTPQGQRENALRHNLGQNYHLRRYYFAPDTLSFSTLLSSTEVMKVVATGSVSATKFH